MKLKQMLEDPYLAPCDHVDLVVIARNLDPDLAETLKARHEAAMRADPVTGAVTYVDGSRDTAEWLRSVEATAPYLLGKGAKPDSTAKPPPAGPVSLTQAMIAASRGEMGPMQAFEAARSTGPGIETTTTFNYTDAMVRARAGDAAALAALHDHMKAKR